MPTHTPNNSLTLGLKDQLVMDFMMRLESTIIAILLVDQLRIVYVPFGSLYRGEIVILGDSHTHLDQYPDGDIPSILDRAHAAQVGLIVCAGSTVTSSQRCVELANSHGSLFAGIGIHPTELDGPVDESVYLALGDLVRDNPKVVCISEIGLDFLPTSPDREMQYQAFRGQIRLAREVRLPIIFHSRESHSEVLRLLREEKAHEVGGVMHYFQGDEATAKAAIDKGFYISLPRPLLRLPELQEVARELPLEHIVLETDSAPQPFKKYRHNWTEPRHTKDVAEKLAQLKGITVEEVAQVTTANLKTLLSLEDKDSTADTTSLRH